MRELTLPGRLVLLPDLGATPDMFYHQRQAFGDRLETPEFPPHQPNESIAAYAQRWAKKLSRPGDNRPLVLGGVSFGGILAQEMAMFLDPKPRAVLLVAAPRQADQVTPLMQLAEVLSRFVPRASVNQALPMMALAFAMRDGLDDDDKGRLIQAARQVDPATTKWASRVAVQWPGYHPPSDYPPVHQIHAQKDWVIKAPNADTPNVQRLEGAHHLLHMTHSQTVNRFLFEQVLAACPQAEVATPHIEDPHTTAERRARLEGAPAGTPLV